MNEAVNRFIEKAIDQTTPIQASEHEIERLDSNQWNELAPGVDSSSYTPKPFPSNTFPINAYPTHPINDTGTVPSNFETSSQTDRKDYFALPGVCGLINLGNTCYMNSGLQCVYSIESIAKFYLLGNQVPKPSSGKKVKQHSDVKNGEDDDNGGGEKGLKRVKVDDETGQETYTTSDEGTSNENKSSSTAKPSEDFKTNTDASSLVNQGHFSSSFSFLLRKLWSGHYSAVVPKNFKTVLGFMCSQFSGLRQQDCQEFLVVLLDRLHEELCANCGESSSIITDTFQGELTSKVTCCRCGHVSTKNDPFMYLSVPIPHAHERQIEIVWCPLSKGPFERKVLKCMVVIPKLSTVLHIKKALCDVLNSDGITSDNVTLAHVKNGSIEFTLADTLASSRVKDSEYVVYGFETDVKAPPTDIVTPPIESKAPVTVEGPSNAGYIQLPNKDNVDSDIADSDPSSNVKKFSDEANPVENMDTETTPLIARDDETTPLMDSTKKVVVMEWHSCSICLEEMIDSELLTHLACGALLCSECLEASKQHSIKENGQMQCPVCQKLINHAQDFTPLSKKESVDNVVRLLQVTMLFRHEEQSGNWTLFGHPAVVNIPQNESVNFYYTTVSHLIPSHLSGQAWSIALTDNRGRYCSRCLYKAIDSNGGQCRGCLLSNAMTDVNLKPGDHFCITFRHLSEHNIAETEKTERHVSLSDGRWSNIVSLTDCLDLFSQKEILSSDNPWWCPQCNSNQEAVRHLKVSRLPHTLIIHLKRFLFQDGAASKVDIGVSFPHTLSPSSVLSDDATPTLRDSNLDLVGCVCHFGTLNSGHYTAYSRHPVSSSWHYYNDETVTEVLPSVGDSSSAYILFYTTQQTKDSVSKEELPIDRGIVSVDEEEELILLEPILRMMKPKPAPLPPPLPPLKRASSLGDIANSASIAPSSLLGDIPVATSVNVSSAPDTTGSSSNPRISDSISNTGIPLATRTGLNKFNKSFEI